MYIILVYKQNIQFIPLGGQKQVGQSSKSFNHTLAHFDL